MGIFDRIYDFFKDILKDWVLSNFDMMFSDVNDKVGLVSATAAQPNSPTANNTVSGTVAADSSSAPQLESLRSLYRGRLHKRAFLLPHLQGRYWHDHYRMAGAVWPNG